MTVRTDASVRRPIALQHDQGEALWFLGARATIKASADTTAGGVAVVEFLAPAGHASPLHVHRNEDESFYVLEGALTFWVSGQVIEAPAGAFVYGPRDIPHTFMVSSPQARFVLIGQPAGFEAFLREAGEPAREPGLPPPPSGPPDVARLAAVAAKYGIEILGPPGIPPKA
jgi:quercetin dioxygenase-like cupin family protein